MRKIVADKKFIAYCGLYCGACKRYLQEKCSACHDNVKATWCQVRACCIEHGYASCADCTLVVNLKDCKKFNNIFSKLFSLLFRSDRFACIGAIKVMGCDSYARDMAEKKIMTIKR